MLNARFEDSAPRLVQGPHDPTTNSFTTSLPSRSIITSGVERLSSLLNDAFELRDEEISVFSRIGRGKTSDVVAYVYDKLGPPSQK